MKELLEQGCGTVLIGIMTGIGLMTRLILLGYYGRLGRACKEVDNTKNRVVRKIREELEQRFRNGGEMKGATVYTECRLAEQKVFGIRLGSLENLAAQSLLLVALCGVLLLLAGLLWGNEGRESIFPLLLCGAAVFSLLLLDLFTGLREKQRRIRLFLRDYIENGCFCPARQGQAVQEAPQRREKEKKSREKKQKPVVETVGRRKDSAAAKPVRRHGKAQEEKRRLTEELLRERRQLEARRFAEQRSRERELPEVLQREPVGEPDISEREAMTEAPVRQEVAETPVQQAVTEAADTEAPVQQAVAEAAATEVTYEALLGEVLKEYLA